MDKIFIETKYCFLMFRRQNIISYLLPNQEDILTKTSSASHEELCSDAADIWDEEAAVGLRRDVRGSVVGELAVPVRPPFGQIVG